MGGGLMAGLVQVLVLGLALGGVYALMGAGLVRSAAPRGRSAPEQTAIEPEPATDSADGGDSSATDSSASSASGGPKTTGATTASTDGASRTEPDEPAANESVPKPGTSRAAVPPAESASDDDRTNPAAERATADESGGERPMVGTAGKFTDAVEQQTLDGTRVADDDAFDRLPRLRVLGQLHDTYVVCESPDGLVLIDQHAADERVNYERLRERFAGETDVQELAEVVTVELTAAEAALFSEFDDALCELGFRAALTDERHIEVRAVPAVLSGAADPELLRDSLSALVESGRPTDTIERAVDALLADLACYPSITGNTSLTEGTVIDLLRALDACENPYACPHGRPVVIEVSEGELADRFERDYPGHAGRRSVDRIE